MDTASGGESFNLDFDDNGNMTTGVSQTITYNWDNKLRTATKGTKSISLRYDPGGNRIRKQSIDGADQIKRKYIVDIVGDLPTTLMEIDPNIGVIVTTYIYANGQVLCRHDGDYSAPLYFYIHDRLGSVRQIINTSGSVVRYYTYEPFGEVLEEDGTLTNYMMFTGQYFDTEIDQYYLRARQYDPHISRFTARDPVYGKFEEPLTLHKYLYCLNDSVNRIDPSGEFAVTRGFTFNLTEGIGGITVTYQYFYGMSDEMEFFCGEMITVAGGPEPGKSFSSNGMEILKRILSPRGEYGLHISFGGVQGYSPNAQSASDLGGAFFEGGSSYGLGYHFGGTWSHSFRTGTDLFMFSFGYGFGVEAHAQFSHTWILVPFPINKFHFC